MFSGVIILSHAAAHTPPFCSLLGACERERDLPGLVRPYAAAALHTPRLARWDAGREESSDRLTSAG